MNRRKFIAASGLVLGSAGSLFSSVAQANFDKDVSRSLHLHNLHTGETVKSVFWEEGEYIVDGLMELNRLLRDFRANEVCVMDPALFDILHSMRQQMPGNKPVHIISGYRSPATNEHLRNSSAGVAKKSYHMVGKAMDFSIPGYSLSDQRKAAVAMKFGGVGYYPESGFLHVDTGRIRQW